MVEADENRMTLAEHFGELRRSLLRAVVGVAVGMAICLLFGEQLMELLCWPVAAAQRAEDLPVRLRALAPAEAFVTYLKVCLLCGAILAAPYSLYQIWKFVAAGLYPHEQRVVRRAVPFSVGLFALGVAFFFIVVAPISLRFFLRFARESYPQPPRASWLPWSADAPEPPAATTAPAPLRVPVLQAPPAQPAEGDVWIDAEQGSLRAVVGGRVRVFELRGGEPFLEPTLTLAHYMTFMALLALAFGVGFQVPIVVLVLAWTGLMTLERLRAVRKYVVMIILVIAAVLTPPDVWSQIALGVPMYLLYELGLWLARTRQPARSDMPR